jgi:hypothetical protein
MCDHVDQTNFSKSSEPKWKCHGLFSNVPQVNSNGADARLFGIGTTLTPSSFVTGLSNQNKPWDPKAAVNIPWYRTPSGFMRQNIFMDIASNINR